MNMEDEVRIKKKIKVFLDNKMPCHIVTKDDVWLNGYVSKIYEEYFDFLDRKEGTLPIFYVDIHKLDFFTGDINSLKKKKNG